MMDATLYRLSILFAIVASGMAGLFVVLLWGVLRDSPVRTSLKLLTGALLAETLHHSGLLVSGLNASALQPLRHLSYGLVILALFAAFVELRSNLWQRDGTTRQTIFLAPLVGLLLYAVGDPLSTVVLPLLTHWIHGFAALFVIAGLYSPVHDALQDGSWNNLSLENTMQERSHSEWMRPIDETILEVLYVSGLVLTPTVIAHNTDYSRDEINRRLLKLETEGLVQRVERGKYRLSTHGQRYLEGEPTR